MLVNYYQHVIVRHGRFLYMRIKQVLQAITYKFVYTALYVVSLLPMTFLYRAGSVAFLIVYYGVRYRRAVVLLNIARSFPEKRYDEINNISKKFYRTVVSNIADTIKAISVSPKILNEKIEFSGLELLDNAIVSGRNVIACLGHCSNWEMLHFMSYKMKHGIYAVYKPLSSGVINRLMIKLRTRFGMKVITDKSIARHIRSDSSSPAVYLFLADQCPMTNDENFKYRFLNQDTYFFPGMEKLARRSNAVVVYLHIKQTSAGRYKVTFRAISTEADVETEGVITRKYVNLLEQNINEQPSSWLWSHKRWKR
ncbi:lysophospholipid acyltransferase family protein [Niabella sp. 22666]|uniref:lysophospholipid acyltransferase family protein n=1 Tax=Niabella sp. 22666 TaxID=3453954 RepID=UPI003F83D44F